MGTKSLVEVDSKSIVEMEVGNVIEYENDSADPFVQALYRDLEIRLQEYEIEGSDVERLKFSDLKSEIIMAVAITAFLISVVI